MTHEEAIKRIKAWNLDSDDMEVLSVVIPELAENEDERIRKGLIHHLKELREWKARTMSPIKVKEHYDVWIAYLEKLKEQKDWAEELNTKIKELHKQCIAAIAEQKEPIDPFDTKLFQDGVKEGRRLEREDMEKEQKPSTEETELNSIAFLEQMGYTCIPPGAKPAEWSEDKFPKDIEKDATQFCFDKGFNITPYQAKEIATHYLMIGHNFGYVEGRKNAHIPAKELGLPSSMDFKQEWSEEDERILKGIIGLIDHDQHYGVSNNEMISWLKSRRPAKDCSSCAKHLEGYISGRSDAENKLLEQFGALITPEDELHIKPRWKPSEDEERLIKTSISFLKDFADKGYENAVECIDWLKSKLNGNTCK